MLDQLFTADNFRRVFDAENRKGLDVANRFFPDLEPHTLSIASKVKEIRTLRANAASLKPEELTVKIAALQQQIANLKSEKFIAIDKAMEAISEKVQKPSFKIALTKKLGPKGRFVFSIDGSPETFFVIKQLQRNINRLYGVKQSNRHDLVCQLRDTIASRFPFQIVRTDISSFYESIDRKKLLEKLDADQLLSSSSKKYIRQVLDSYGSLAGTPKGIPRGVGISAYLAELYLRPVDRAIKGTRELVLYCRFVDDIVAVFAPSPEGSTPTSYKAIVLEAISNNNLSHNPKKTMEFSSGSASTTKFEYLGYRFVLKGSDCLISPSAAKISKYKQRLNAAFTHYQEKSKLNGRQAYRELVARVKFLTGNTRLSNSKSGAVTGIYYNNSIVTDLSSFDILDKRLKAKINAIKRPKLRKRLKNYVFSKGFSERRFHNFSTRELQTIVRAWKHG